METGSGGRLVEKSMDDIVMLKMAAVRKESHLETKTKKIIIKSSHNITLSRPTYQFN